MQKWLFFHWMKKKIINYFLIILVKMENNNGENFNNNISLINLFLLLNPVQYQIVLDLLNVIDVQNVHSFIVKHAAK
jgi:hypothetical protein